MTELWERAEFVKHDRTECPVCGHPMAYLFGQRVQCEDCKLAGPRDIIGLLTLKSETTCSPAKAI